MSNAAPAVTRIRTEVAAATTQSTNHYTDHGKPWRNTCIWALPLLFSQEHPFPSSIETGTLFPVFI